MLSPDAYVVATVTVVMELMSVAIVIDETLGSPVGSTSLVIALLSDEYVVVVLVPETVESSESVSITIVLVIVLSPDVYVVVRALVVALICEVVLVSESAGSSTRTTVLVMILFPDVYVVATVVVVTASTSVLVVVVESGGSSTSTTVVVMVLSPDVNVVATVVVVTASTSSVVVWFQFKRNRGQKGLY